MSEPTAPIPPGATVGILGGGQLGRMTAMAAARLGYRCHVFAPEPQSPAADVAAAWTRADYGDRAALDAFARSVDVVTLEFENVPVSALRHLADQIPVRPGAKALTVTQDRVLEKRFLTSCGVPIAPFLPVASAEEIAAALGRWGGSGVLKTTRLGYDGKGQRMLSPGADLEAAFRGLEPTPLVLEQRVAFVAEISVVTARGVDGRVASYPAVENRHRDHILATTLAPASLPPAVARDAINLAERVAVALGIVGLLAVEMFLLEDDRLLVNELAPRPHNSGHWTLDACPVSQFEQLVRAVCGLPLGDPTPFSAARMDNLLGDTGSTWLEALADRRARLHLYGKSEAKPGRKMGHVTRLTGPHPSP